MIIKNGSRHSRPIMEKIIDAFSRLPAFARQSFTSTAAPSFVASGLWKMDSAPGAGSAIRIHRGKKGAVENTNKRIRRLVPSNTELSAVGQQQRVALATTSIHCPGSALVTRHQPRCSGRICEISVVLYPPLVIVALWRRFSTAKLKRSCNSKNVTLQSPYVPLTQSVSNVGSVRLRRTNSSTYGSNPPAANVRNPPRRGRNNS
ncbi:hypothetical protein ILFOPFJJ_06742 [Ensifer psoraleae]|nr:hypothetical protein [Sinorhizobium psoraleae]